MTALAQILGYTPAISELLWLLFFGVLALLIYKVKKKEIKMEWYYSTILVSLAFVVFLFLAPTEWFAGPIGQIFYWMFKILAYLVFFPHLVSAFLLFAWTFFQKLTG